ncbi:MAG: 2-hydroxyacyl-CoA dehydratase family protein [Pseudomonadota bacterium]
MKAMDRLSFHLNGRLEDLKRAKAKGRKIIGYPGGGYFPEELVLAAGAVPVGLIRGGEHRAVELSSAYVTRWIDTFCRAQIGYGISGEDPWYEILDLLVIPITDNNVRAMSDVLAYHTDMAIFPFGVPHTKEESSYRYYRHGVTRIKEKLESVTGVQITEDRLKDAIRLCNRERALFKEISLMRKANPPPISAKQFVALNHASFFADKEIMVEILETVQAEIKEGNPPYPPGAPRILLTGSTLAMGDEKVLDLIEKAGGVVVMEDFFEGIRPYWESVRVDGDPIEAISECYFLRRVPPAWFRPGTERLDFLIHLARDYQVAGVIWYLLMYRESYKIESYYFPNLLRKETGLSMMTIESDYDPSEIEAMRTRIETYIETIKV